jgi:4-amino-4-deoxy-L-arabinose transferase-like glycosyltransferase
MNRKYWSLGLLVTSLFLWLIFLGNSPLRDWDEGIVAQVAREIWRSPVDKMVWLYPTLGGEPYYNKPPLIHWLIAVAYSLGGVNEWTTRLPSAVLTALGVPLLYSIGNLLFNQSLPSLFTSLVYMTMLPIVRHGRLAMLDGAVITFFLLLLLCILRSRHQGIYALGIGFSLGLITLTKGMIVLLMGGIAGLFILVHRRFDLLKNLYLWIGILLGNALPIAWYIAQWQHYGEKFSQINLQSQTFARVVESVEGHSEPAWFYLIEILKYGFPWLLFLPGGLYLAWKKRHTTWGCLILIGTVIYLVTISFMNTKLPWYVMPIYPFLALAVGVNLSKIWQESKFKVKLWAGFFAILSVAGLGGCTYFILTDPQPILIAMSIILAISMGIAAWLVIRQHRNFIPVLFAGMYLVLLLLMSSKSWIWELNEAFPVKPVAALIRQNIPAGIKIYTSFSYSRPSLDFYTDCRVIAVPVSVLQQMLSKKSYLLVDNEAWEKIDLNQSKIIGESNGFKLISPDNGSL